MTDIAKMRPWTESDAEFFDRSYGLIPATELARVLNRPPASLHTRAYQRGLTKRAPNAPKTDKTDGPPRKPTLPGFVHASRADKQLRRRAEKQIVTKLEEQGFERPNAELAAYLICTGKLPNVEVFLVGRKVG